MGYFGHFSRTSLEKKKKFNLPNLKIFFFAGHLTRKITDFQFHKSMTTNCLLRINQVTQRSKTRLYHTLVIPKKEESQSS